ncbi:electron transport complex subunit RsxA [Sinimarinibacterium sp. CAU 1509]|uniref:electron transport complex subunit RsxA n=1 Tax=Sinimarinibacterium sp. CAU 1509 TaxID=2562283 RepID=UPI0010AC4D12|nr:electron transport complex subunit RsxA [Sinimarinibacterium sp. CAU 1509]TJY62897.1 electron transport complex subunit RsxA [Sinimarinibacterium sp. CAU 1509]
MIDYLLILVGAVLVHNFVLVQFLGLCPFMGTSKKVATSSGLALATTFVLTLTAVATYLVNTYILVPLGLAYLQTITFILVIAVAVQTVEMVVHKTSPLLYQVLGIYLPLITTNCIVLGVALLNVRQAQSFMESMLTGLGAGLGFSLVLLLFAGIRERLAVADMPEAFKGAPIALVTAGIMSLAFMGFSGLD